MKIKYISILLLGLLNIQNCIFAQQKVMYNYKGNGSDTGINFCYNIVLTYDRSITLPYSMPVATGANKGVYSNHIKPDAILNNTLSNVYRVISSPNNKVTYTVYETAIDDYYQNNVFVNIASGYNQSTVSIPIAYNNMSTSVNLVNAVSNGGSFPVNKPSLPSTVLKYLNASAQVESTDANIKSRAQSITAGCTDYRTAVIKLCQWIEGNITMDNAASQTKSTQVLTNKKAKCDGAAHLLAAFCRSLDIPARIVSGLIIQHGVSFPTNIGTLTMGGNGNGTTVAGHAACEIYVPHMSNWVRCDPAQRYALFGPQQFIKVATGAEDVGLRAYGYYWNPVTTQNPRPKPTKITMSENVSVPTSGRTANFQFVSSETFSGTTSNVGLVCAAVPEKIITGIDDEITMQDRLCPNLVDDWLTLPCNGESVRVEIYDLRGARLFSGTLSNKDACQLNVSFLNTGLYIVRVDGETYKIVKN